MTTDQRSGLAIFTAILILGEIAAAASIQLSGIYRYGENLLDAVTARVGWSTYSSGMGVGLALLVAGMTLYARMQGVRISAWPEFASGLSKLCAAMLVLTPLLGQVNTYTAMCSGLGAGVENASLVGTKIAEALWSTICGYAAFSVLLVVYIFTLNRKDREDEGA
jgi:hypothetical protein